MIPVPTVSAELPLDLDRAAAWRRLRDLSSPHLYVPFIARLLRDITLAQKMHYETGQCRKH